MMARLMASPSQRILLTSFGSFGDVFPYLAIARGLKERGHHVVIAMPGYYKQTVEAQGHEFRAIRPEVDPTDAEVVRRAMHRTRGPEVIVRELLMSPLRESYEDLHAACRDVDLIVSHPITFAAPLVAEKLAKPWVSTVLSPVSFFSAHEMPVLPGMPGWLYWAGVRSVAGTMLMPVIRWWCRNWTKPVRALRAELGLPQRGDPLFEGQHSPRLVLALFSKVLATPQPDWPANAIVTGYPFYDQPGELTDDLKRFLDAGAPPVVFTLGSAAPMAAGEFYRESLKAAKSLGIRAVMMTGMNDANQFTEALPNDVIAIDYAPHAKLFPRASVIVHHGGIGTTGETLRSGRPMLVVPHSHDQPDNAFRVTNLDVARTLPAHRYKAARVARQLRALLHPDYAGQAEEISRIVQAESGVTTACDAIEEVANEQRPHAVSPAPGPPPAS